MIFLYDHHDMIWSRQMFRVSGGSKYEREK
jgi:hypothetical protein